MTRLLALLLLLTACSAEDAPAPAPGDERPANAPVADVARVDEYLSRLAAMGFSGAVIVARGDKVLLREGYGLADRESRRPYDPATVQTHGSITKQMTAAAILLLAQRGELDTGDPITRYFEGVPADKQGITLHHLLTHSSGLPGGIGPDDEPVGADEFVTRAMAEPLGFEPGEAYDYSNVGYSLLGIIVERVSEQPYESFLRKELLLPAGLRETGYLLPEWESGRLAVGYRDGETWGRVHRRGWRDDGPGWHLRANGGLHTTIDDMHAWLSVLKGEGPLSPEMAERWTTGYVEEGGGSRYAYGWAVHDGELGRMVAHNGGNGIFSADFVWLPEREFFFYVQGNTSVIPAARLRESILAAAYDPEFWLPPRVDEDESADPAAAESLAGDYLMDGGSIRLEPDDIRLIAQVSGQPALNLMFGYHGDPIVGVLRKLNDRTMRAMERLQAGREDAFEGLVDEETDAAGRARSMLQAIERGGELQSLELVGSVANAPGSRYGEYGAWTTFVRAEFDQGTQVWGVLWRMDETYRGTGIGPPGDLPSFVLVPRESGDFLAIQREPAWRRLPVRFEDGCLDAESARACR